MPSYKTIRDGQVAALWHRNGNCAIVKGPRRIFVFRAKLQFLSVYSADQSEYLKIKHLDGRIEHRQGPQREFCNPLLYQRIDCCKAMSLTSHQVIVVYRPSPAYAPKPEVEGGQAPQGYTAKVSRTIIRGPAVHVPEPEEFTHVFKWHGVDGDSKTHFIPGSNIFEKLSIVPDQLYYNIRDVRTKDDALITAKVMIFYELTDLELMLDTTPDPIGDFINAVCGDVVAFCAVRGYEEFVSETDKLSKLETFPQLTMRAERSGYKISKVVFRGYHCSESLALMHSQAMESRTQLRLQSDTQQQTQDLEDFKLNRELERFERRREMEQQEARHKQEMSTAQTEAQLKAKTQEAELQLYVKRKEEEQTVTFLQNLAGMSVDLTRYLVAQHERPDKILRLEAGSGSALPAQTVLHFSDAFQSSPAVQHNA